MNRVINFEPQKHLLKKVNAYIESEELFQSERDQALPLLLKALKFADNHLKQEIIMRLGCFAEQEVSRQLYQIIINTDEDEEIRLCASVYLSIIFPFLETPQPLVEQLIKELKSPDPEMRMYIALALGWEGNTQALNPLIELLYDTDSDVQFLAIIALSNLKDDPIFNFLEITEIREYIPTYLECLKDKDSRIADLALNRLNEVNSALLIKFKTTIYGMLEDPDMRVKKAAMKLIKKFKDYV